MKVMIAVDGSDCSLTAAESVIARPWPEDSEFMVVSVVEPALPGFAGWHKCSSADEHGFRKSLVVGRASLSLTMEARLSHRS